MCFNGTVTDMYKLTIYIFALLGCYLIQWYTAQQPPDLKDLFEISLFELEELY